MAYQYSHLPHGLPQYLPPGCKFLSCHDAQNVLRSCSTWRLPNGTLVTPLGGELYQVVEVPANCDERCSLHQVCRSLDVLISRSLRVWQSTYPLGSFGQEFREGVSEAKREPFLVRLFYCRFYFAHLEFNSKLIKLS